VIGQGGVPSGAVPVTGNLTVTSQTKAGHVSLTTDAEAAPGTPTINCPLGDTLANGVTVSLTEDGPLSRQRRSPTPARRPTSSST
jgi:hypothetical protein